MIVGGRGRVGFGGVGGGRGVCWTFSFWHGESGAVDLFLEERLSAAGMKNPWL